MRFSVAAAFLATGAMAYEGSTLTDYTTKLVTVTDCEPTVTDCPAESTTVATETVPLTTSTVYTTSVHTITDCGPGIPDCPEHSTIISTETVAISTTICPVEPTETPEEPELPEPTEEPEVPDVPEEGKEREEERRRTEVSSILIPQWSPTHPPILVLPRADLLPLLFRPLNRTTSEPGKPGHRMETAPGLRVDQIGRCGLCGKLQTPGPWTLIQG